MNDIVDKDDANSSEDVVRLLELDLTGIEPIGGFVILLLCHSKMWLFFHICRCTAMASLFKFKELWLLLQPLQQFCLFAVGSEFSEEIWIII